MEPLNILIAIILLGSAVGILFLRKRLKTQGYTIAAIQKQRDSYLATINQRNEEIRQRVNREETNSRRILRLEDNIAESRDDYDRLKQTYLDLVTLVFSDRSTPFAYIEGFDSDDPNATPYYSFDVKKETGITVSKRVNKVPTKMKAKIGFNLEGLLLTADDYKEALDEVNDNRTDQDDPIAPWDKDTNKE